MVSVDLNSDLGEGAGRDEQVMPHITSTNIACGAHAGDADTIARTIELALRHGVAVGAHPGYPDKANFGRVAIEMAPGDLVDEIRAQLEAIHRVAEQAGATLAHVKAHGALYNKGERDDTVAASIVEAVRSFDEDLVLFAPPGSAMERAAKTAGISVAREGFADRAYEPDGTLRSRKLPGAVHTDPAAAAAQAVRLAPTVDTICIHGDTPGAPAIARAVRRALADAGIEVRALSKT
ncbi:MAG: LamB/YcsF family protein [Chloroflexi bacterium]|nr:LamB/YcsF family protein [Chloroflexota bacterium]